ncbi:MAG: alpha/beta fold hydrolase [Gammaproteobacteria bacterium]
MNTFGLQRPQRAVGERPTVIGLHAAAGSAQQWRPLAERLRIAYRVLAPDLHAHATRHALGTGEALSLDGEAALIEPLVDAFHGPVYLVGHDHGAAVAMKLAQRRRERIAGLVLYEPTPAGLLLVDPRSRHAALDIAVLRRVRRRYLEAGAWFRAAIARFMPDVCARIDAPWADPTPAHGHPCTRVSTARVARHIARTLPRAEWRRLDGTRERRPGAHPEEVDRAIERFLAEHAGAWYRDPDPTTAFGFRAFVPRRGFERAGAASSCDPASDPAGSRSPDEAQRNPGRCGGVGFPLFHPGYVTANRRAETIDTKIPLP